MLPMAQFSGSFRDTVSLYSCPSEGFSLASGQELRIAEIVFLSYRI